MTGLRCRDNGQLSGVTASQSLPGAVNASVPDAPSVTSAGSYAEPPQRRGPGRGASCSLPRSTVKPGPAPVPIELGPYEPKYSDKKLLTRSQRQPRSAAVTRRRPVGRLPADHPPGRRGAPALKAIRAARRPPYVPRAPSHGHQPCPDRVPAQWTLCVPARTEDGVLANQHEEPVTEARCCLDHAAAEKVDVRVQEVRGYREQPAHGHGLLLENLEGQWITGFPVAPDKFEAMASGSTLPARGQGTGPASRAAGSFRSRSATRRSRRPRTDRSCRSASAGRARAAHPSGSRCTEFSAIPAAPRTTLPASITPPPRPVPTIADTEECRAAISGPKCA